MVESREIQRVPSFIQFHQESPNESESNSNRFHPSGRPKRKNVSKSTKYQAQFSDDEEPKKKTRKTKAERVPKKKSKEKVLKKTVKNKTSAAKNESNDDDKQKSKHLRQAKEEVWIGAACERGRGAYVCYFGEHDSRNRSIIYDKSHSFSDSNEIYIKAIADILESKPTVKKYLIIYHGSRDLILDINGGSEDANASTIERVQLLLKKSEPKIQVRRLTSRKTAEEHTVADKLALELLKEAIEQEKAQKKEMNITDNQKENHAAKKTNDVNMITLEEETTVTEKITIEMAEQTARNEGEKSLLESINELSQGSSQGFMEDPMEIFEKNITLETSQDLIQEPLEKAVFEEQPPLVRESSISNLLGSLWNTLSYPFKSKK